jgi:putative transposase
MKTSQFNEIQNIQVIMEHEGERKFEDIERVLGISQGTFFKWKQKYRSLEAIDVKRLNDLNLLNRRLKSLLADTILDKEILKDVIEKKGWGPTSRGNLSRRFGGIGFNSQLCR